MAIMAGKAPWYENIGMRLIDPVNTFDNNYSYRINHLIGMNFSFQGAIEPLNALEITNHGNSNELCCLEFSGSGKERFGIMIYDNTTSNIPYYKEPYMKVFYDRNANGYYFRLKIYWLSEEVTLTEVIIFRDERIVQINCSRNVRVIVTGNNGQLFTSEYLIQSDTTGMITVTSNNSALTLGYNHTSQLPSYTSKKIIGNIFIKKNAIVIDREAPTIPNIKNPIDMLPIYSVNNDNYQSPSKKFRITAPNGEVGFLKHENASTNQMPIYINLGSSGKTKAQISNGLNNSESFYAVLDKVSPHIPMNYSPYYVNKNVYLPAEGGISCTWSGVYFWLVRDAPIKNVGEVYLRINLKSKTSGIANNANWYLVTIDRNDGVVNLSTISQTYAFKIGEAGREYFLKIPTYSQTVGGFALLPYTSSSNQSYDMSHYINEVYINTGDLKIYPQG